MALSAKDIALIGDMIEQRIEKAFIKRTTIDGETHKLDHEFTRQQRQRYERCQANRQQIINKTIVGVGVALILGFLYMAPALVKAWLQEPPKLDRAR